jgi:hypothetical protein
MARAHKRASVGIHCERNYRPPSSRVNLLSVDPKTILSTGRLVLDAAAEFDAGRLPAAPRVPQPA